MNMLSDLEQSIENCIDEMQNKGTLEKIVLVKNVFRDFLLNEIQQYNKKNTQKTKIKTRKKEIKRIVNKI
jgi:hypothetical protein